MRRAIALLLIAAGVAIDRVLKELVETRLFGVADYPRIDGFVAIHYAQNTGAAFGILSDSTKVLSICTAIAIAVGLVALMLGKIRDRVIFWGMALIASGGLGNLYDRVFKGYVVDYIEPLFVNFAIFNFADCLVSVGAFLIIFKILYDSFKEKRGSKN